MKTLIAVSILIIFSLFSCGPKPINPWVPPEIKFEKTPEYSVQEQLDAIPKPEAPVRVFVKDIGNNSYQVTENKEEATHIMLAPKEYAKVGAVVKLAKTYKGLILDQEILINTYINQINALKELYALEQQKSNMYRELWISSENAYRQEVRDHKIDNFFHKTALYGVTFTSIIVMLLLL